MAGLAPITTPASLAAVTEDLRAFRMSRKSRKSQASILDTSSASASNESRTTYGSSSAASSSDSRPSLASSERRKSGFRNALRFGGTSKNKQDSISLPFKLNLERLASPTQSFNILLSLPTEVQLNILSYLDTLDLLHLRLVSPSSAAILNHNAVSITRDLLLQPLVVGQRSSTNLLNVYEVLLSERSFPNPNHHGFLLNLYPPTYTNPTSSAYLLRMLRRRTIITRQLSVLLTFIQTRVYMLKLTQHLPTQHFSSYREGLRHRLFEPLANAQHYLECIRHLVLHIHPRHQTPLKSCPSCLAKLKQTTLHYRSTHLLSTFHVISLLLSHLRAAVRSPSTVSSLERRLRGWGYGPPPEQHLRQIVLLGTLSELGKIDEMKGSYAKRLSVIKNFADNIDSARKLNSGESDLYIVYGQGRIDPVMGRSSLSSSLDPFSKTKSSGLNMMDLTPPDAVEYLASSRSTVKSLDVDYEHVNDSVLSSLPDLEEFLIGTDSILAQRIIKEGIVSDAGGLTSPYLWLQGAMRESYDGRREPGNESNTGTNASTTRQGSMLDVQEGSNDGERMAEVNDEV